MTFENFQVSAPTGAVGTVQVRGISKPGYLGVVLPGVPEAIAAARWLLHRSFGASATDDLVLCASELATNAVLHTRSGLPGGSFMMTAQLEGGNTVLVNVLDEGARTSQDRSQFGLPGEHGRGLDIVGALTIEHGEAPSFAGRRSWFRVKITDAPVGRPNRDAQRDAAETLRRDAAETPARDAALAGSRS